jgi:hypothetical protein
MTRKMAITLLVVFAGIQLIRPSKNRPFTTSEPNDLFTRYQATDEVKRVMVAACYDCHSNKTRYPWYAEIQPGGRILAKHVSDGEKRLNFSEIR